MSEKSEIGVELISDNCKYCPCLELETFELMGQKHHRCKYLQMCRAVLAYWKNGDFLKNLETEAKKCPNNGTEEVVVDVFGHRYVKDHDKQGWTGVEVEKPHDYIVRNEYAESRRTAEEESVKFWGKASGRVVDNNGETLTWNEH